MVLRLAIKGCNDTLGPEGLVPTLLVFGTMPPIPVAKSNYPKQKDRMKALQLAKAEMEQIIAE